MLYTFNKIIKSEKQENVPVLKFEINNIVVIFIDGRMAEGYITDCDELPYRLGKKEEQKYSEITAWKQSVTDLRFVTAPPGTTATVEVLTVEESRKGVDYWQERGPDGKMMTTEKINEVSPPERYKVYLINEIKIKQ